MNKYRLYNRDEFRNADPNFSKGWSWFGILMLLVAEGTAVPFANFTTVCSNKSFRLRVCRPEMPH